jgi:hypothetical protein
VVGYDLDGNPVLPPEEVANQRAKRERQRAERLSASLRELAEDTKTLSLLTGCEQRPPHFLEFYHQCN